MEKLIIITPHMSTGGCPQFVLKRIEMLKDFYDIYCIEYNFVSSHYVVQRNKVIEIIGDRFIPIFGNKDKLIEILTEIKPDIIHIEEFSESFIDIEVCNFIFKVDRTYKIIETTHGSDNRSTKKVNLPDKFIFVSDWSKNMYSHFDVDSVVIEYPIDKKEIDIEAKTRLGFDDEYKHIINIGLFTPGKNQAYIFEIARLLLDEKIKFHFIGNQAENFRHYWEPLMLNKPENCIIWGERSDVDDFIMASNLFLFTSKLELNPLVVKESLCYDIPILMFNLETYCGNYNNQEGVTFLSGDINTDIKTIKNLLK
jgi:glycosyltransferase involved in cell wall biosynthesis